MRKNFGVKTWIFPQPVLMLGTYDEKGVPNLMNAAWGGIYDYDKVEVNLSDHKTTKNLLVNKAFTLSMATKKTVKESDYFGIVSGNNINNKFEKSGLHAVQSKKVEAPIIEEYPICMECKVESFEDDGVLVKILNVQAEEKYLNEDGTIKLNEVGIISYDPYGHGYYVVGDKVGQAFSEGKKLI